MSSIVDREDGSIFDGLVEEDDKDKAKREPEILWLWKTLEKKKEHHYTVRIKEDHSEL